MFITARIHPGETISSYVCEAIIQYLLSYESVDLDLNRKRKSWEIGL